MYLSEGYISDLAKLFGVKNSMIVNIKQRRTHKNITNDLGPAGVYWSGELSPQIIKDICESTRSVAELAKKYGIVDNTVRYVRKKHGSVIPVKTQRQPLTKEQVIEIYHSTLSLKELNDKFGTDNHAVIKIKQKIRFKNYIFDISEPPGICRKYIKQKV
jgi:transposase-like protein